MKKESKLPVGKPYQREVASTKDALASFLFDLIRDHVPLGTVEKIISTQERIGPTTVNFSDVDLGKYVINLAGRIHALNIDASVTIVKKESARG